MTARAREDAVARYGVALHIERINRIYSSVSSSGKQQS
jgi:hypothetical protein